MTDHPIPTSGKKLGVTQSHPAVFSNGFIDIFRGMLHEYLARPWKFPEPLILDPFAGVGTIHELRPEFVTVGVEIEKEWAEVSPFTVCGDSTNLPKHWTGMFQAVVTSPTYGNRMADHHTPGDCTHCDGLGMLTIDVTTVGATTRQYHHEQCPKCLGTGKESSKRITYRHKLGRPLTANNTGMFQFTQPAYAELHRQVYIQCNRVLEDNGLMIVNVSDHIRKGNRINVVEAHKDWLSGAGFMSLAEQPVNTQRMGFGANHDLRVDTESILIYRKVKS